MIDEVPWLKKFRQANIIIQKSVMSATLDWKICLLKCFTSGVNVQQCKKLKDNFYPNNENNKTVVRELIKKWENIDFGI